MILVVQGQLPHYRRELFNALCEIDEVTVVHSGTPAKNDTDGFSEIILPVRSIGPFRLQQGLPELIARMQPRTVVAMFDVRWINSIRAMFRFDRSLNWVWWGLDKGASELALRAKLAIAGRPNPVVFYNYFTREIIGRQLAPQGKLFVANNTIHVPDRVEGYLHAKKKRFINVGTLDSRKQNDVTIRVLHKIFQDTDTDVQFTLIGDGQEKNKLQGLIDELNLHDRVELVGRIEDPKVLAGYYSEALASVSFGQAGLAVLQSMAFGVPFVTKENAISGGEKNNIQDGVNGIFCDDNPMDLERVLRKLIQSPEYAQCLGQAAYNYYSDKATVENMVTNFEEAIAYAEENRD